MKPAYASQNMQASMASLRPQAWCTGNWKWLKPKTEILKTETENGNWKLKTNHYILIGTFTSLQRLPDHCIKRHGYLWHSRWHAWLIFSCELSLLTQMTGRVVPNLLMQKGDQLEACLKVEQLLAYSPSVWHAVRHNVTNTQLAISDQLSVAQLAAVTIRKTYLYTDKVGVRLHHPPYTWPFISNLIDWLID